MNDEIRRQAREIQADHERSMPQLREGLDRLFEDETRTADEKNQLLLRGLRPSSVFTVAGLTVAGAAILAACGDDKGTIPGGTSGPGPTSAPPGGAGATQGTGDEAPDDVTTLRTITSLENLAVTVYQTAIDSRLATTKAVADAAGLFQMQHMEHAALFASETTKAGGEPFADPNPVVLEAIQPMIDALADETGVVMLAYDLEVAAAQTYQSFVGTVTDLRLNQAFMGVGGVEARHAAVLASVLGKTPIIDQAFQGVGKAVPSGTGV